MGVRDPITPADLAKAQAVYLETASYACAARAIGRDTSAVRRRMLAQGQPERATLYARTLDAVMSEAMRAQREAVRVLRRDVKASDPKVAHSATAQLNDTLRAASTTRTALAKLSGEHAAERHDVSVGTPDEFTSRIDRLAASVAAGSVREKPDGG